MSGAAAATSAALSEKLVSSLAAVLLPAAQGRGPQLRAKLASRLREVAAALDASAVLPIAAGIETSPALEPSQAVPASASPECFGAEPTNPGKRKKARKEFDMARFPQRTITLEIFYAGWNYAGFATQGDGPGCSETVEMHLWRALKKTRLVAPEATWAQSGYSRCGRTDAGVSAMRQVVALRVRSNLGQVLPYPQSREPQSREGDAAAAREVCVECISAHDAEKAGDEISAQSPPEGPEQTAEPQAGAGQGPAVEKEREEIDYVNLLNRNLPEDIRILRWGDIPGPDFSARFSAEWRQYKYFFFADGLDIERMREARAHREFTPEKGGGGGSALCGALRQRCVRLLSMASLPGVLLRVQAIRPRRQAAALFVGEHDFRNFCKMDAENVHNFRRRVIWIAIEPEGERASPSGAGAADDSQLWSFNVRGTAFLWHQVRCMMAVLFLVGKGLEEPSVVAKLLDLEATRRKPVYPMAAEEPLVLYTCGYKTLELGCSDTARRHTAAALHALARRHALRAKTLYLAHRHIVGDGVFEPQDDPARAGGVKHVALLQRPTEKTYDERKAGAVS